jgi:hypothetical protein
VFVASSIEFVFVVVVMLHQASNSSCFAWLVHEASNSYYVTIIARRRRASAREIKTTSNKHDNKQRESVCTFSGWPTAVVCLSHRLNVFVTHFRKIKNRSETCRYLFDLDGMGCNINGKTCPVVLVMVPMPETAK